MPIVYGIEKCVAFDQALISLFGINVPKAQETSEAKYNQKNENKKNGHRISKRSKGYEVYYNERLSRFSFFPSQNQEAQSCTPMGQEKYIVSLLEAPSRRGSKRREMVS